MLISMYSVDAIVCLQIPHPAIVTPSRMDRLLPSVPTAVTLVTIGLAVLAAVAVKYAQPTLSSKLLDIFLLRNM